MRNRTRPVLLLAVALAAGPALTGCGGNGRLTCHPVSGQVLYNGEPLAGVDVAFHPADPKNDTGYPPHATTDADGRFKLMTYSAGDGAPAGEWKVAVAFAVQANDDGADQTVRLAAQVPAKYHRKDTTPVTATIRPGENTLDPFRLDGPPLPKTKKKK